MRKKSLTTRRAELFVGEMILSRVCLHLRQRYLPDLYERSLTLSTMRALGLTERLLESTRAEKLGLEETAR